MDKKELEARIELHEGCIKSLRAELAEAEKPKLAFLDIGISDTQKWINLNGHTYWIHGRDKLVMDVPSDCLDESFLVHDHTNVLDVLDDLTAQAEPLTEFKFKNGVYMDIKGVWGNDSLKISDEDGYMVIQKENLPAFILNLQRLLATAMRNT